MNQIVNRRRFSAQSEAGAAILIAHRHIAHKNAIGIHRLVMHLLNLYTEELTLESVSEALGYSKHHVSHAIADAFRCNFRTLVNSHRINSAQTQLLSTEKSVSQIAYACGFQNQSSFNRIFLKHCGITPSSFRCRQSAPPDEPLL